MDILNQKVRDKSLHEMCTGEMGDAGKRGAWHYGSGAEHPIRSFISAIDGLDFCRVIDDLDLYTLKFNPNCLCRNKRSNRCLAPLGTAGMLLSWILTTWLLTCSVVVAVCVFWDYGCTKYLLHCVWHILGFHNNNRSYLSYLTIYYKNSCKEISSFRYR